MIERLRQLHPRFIYRGYDIAYREGNVELVFDFLTEPDIVFHPRLTLVGLDAQRWTELPPAVINNLAFHLGLMEVPSYWKATCSPEIVVEAGPLDGAQIAWWKDLFLKGMGEFFFINDIDFTPPDFLTIRAADNQTHLTSRYDAPLPERVLVPIGGGKDSVVTLALLRQSGIELGCMGLNPIQAAQAIMQSCPDQVLARRVIDERLLQLNAQGYLNGHTPFSAYLAFLSVTCAILYGYRNIAISNESSSNEGNRVYRGVAVNHQYSKTYDFETRFRAYSQYYLAPQAEYFSFLRPINELQIAAVFARMPAYHPVFLSCNRGQKTNVWCHNCPKCLFTFTVLYPFLGPAGLGAIFSHDLFTREDLIPLALELVGAAEQKPFECVGTFADSTAAFYLSAEQIRRQSLPLPVMLQHLQDHVQAGQAHPERLAQAVLAQWDTTHAIPAQFEAILRAAVSNISAPDGAA